MRPSGAISSKARCWPCHPILQDRLRLPVIGSPMLIVSGPELVIARCKSGLLGVFPALGRQPDEWIC